MGTDDDKTLRRTISNEFACPRRAWENLRKLHAQSGCSLTFIYGTQSPTAVKSRKRYTVKGNTVNGRVPGWFSPSSAIFFFFFSLFAVYSTEIWHFSREKAVLKINLLGKRLTQGISGDRGSPWWAPVADQYNVPYRGLKLRAHRRYWFPIGSQAQSSPKRGLIFRALSCGSTRLLLRQVSIFTVDASRFVFRWKTV